MIAVIGPYHGGTSATIKALAEGGVFLGHPDKVIGHPDGKRAGQGPPYPCYEHRPLQQALKRCWEEGPMTEKIPFDERVQILQAWADTHPQVEAIKHPLLCLMGDEMREVWGDALEIVRVDRDYDTIVAGLRRNGGFWPKYHRALTTTLIVAADTQDSSLVVDYEDLNHRELVRQFGSGKRGRFFDLANLARMDIKGATHCPNHNSTLGLADFIDNEVPRTGKFIEFGTYHGVSTEMFALLRPKLTIVTVDESPRPVASGRLAKYQNVSPVASDWIALAAHIPDGTLDGIYLDADHDLEPMRAALKAWRPKIKRGGVIAGHDYWHKFPGVMESVTEHFGRLPDRIYSDSTWVYRV